MDFIRQLRENTELADLLCDVCDVEILPEFRKPQDENGHISYNLSGKTFAGEKNGSEYILLEDGSVGYWGSEGRCGRIADSLPDFFTFVINWPCWKDCLWEWAYQDREELREFAEEIFQEYEEVNLEDGFDLSGAQQELAGCLGIERGTEIVDLLMKFYHCTTRKPRFIYTYTEDDGSRHSGTGSLFDS